MQGDLKDNSHADLPSVMPAFIEFIEAGLSAGGVLVHCRAGRSRSVAVVVGYLMARFREGYFTCLQKVQRARTVVCIATVRFSEHTLRFRSVDECLFSQV